ncbi:MAG: TRIC cation channel family protein [Ignavibacteriales bacterium]|nr:TRIC cation channel family protein [Ignavibacteriales bacterium]
MIGIFEITDIIGTVSFAISGFLVGAREKLDLFGVLIVSILTALGGGIVRDTIANRLPYSLTDLTPITIVLIAIWLCILFRINRKNDLDQKNIL